MARLAARQVRIGASLLLALALVAPAAHAQRMLEPSEYLRDPTFKPLYVKALGPKAKMPWLAKMDGPAPTTRKVVVQGNEYVLSAFCKNHDCYDNSAVLLYAAPRGVLYGTIYEKGRSTLIGDPPAPVAADLARLWKVEWRSQPK
jgi:hypothetical protein